MGCRSHSGPTRRPVTHIVPRRIRTIVRCTGGELRSAVRDTEIERLPWGAFVTGIRRPAVARAA
ncbi:hypothetical protein ACFPM0_35835 [Pseudonocardia sulfidoxydans]